MDVERVRILLMALPHAVETMQWGDNLVFWVGDKALGGKMFALVTLDGRFPVASFAAGPERAAELCEVEGFRPAPYLARAHWIAADDWKVLSAREWERELAAAHAYILAKLPARTRSTLSLPPAQQNALIAEWRQRKASVAARKRPAKKLRGAV